MLTIETTSPEATRAWAGRLARHLQPGDFIALEGDLGAGKTCLVQGLCAALGVTEGVKSPTFVLLHQYPVGGAVGTVNHFDLYRLDDPGGLHDLGYEDYFYGDGVSVVEWSERARDLLPPDRLTIRLEPGDGEDARRLLVSASGPRSHQLLEAGAR